jgi:hypothetical protein
MESEVQLLAICNQQAEQEESKCGDPEQVVTVTAFTY